MKYTLCITQRCNMDCTYCYIGKKRARMSLPLARDIVDFIFDNTPAEEKIDVGFFGGEPLLEFELIAAITEVIESHPRFGAHPVDMAIVTNGTIFNDTIAEFVNTHNMGFTVSCDGPSQVQDLFRRFPDGTGTSPVVENTIRRALAAFSFVPVNAVYHPRTLHHLPQTVAYLSGLGVRQIYLSPDFSASWTQEDAALLAAVYGRIAEQYIDYYRAHDPHFISLIDSKIVVLLRGGYDPLERCRMGRGEFAFTPDGRIYPCERLIGSGQDEHCIGHVGDGLPREKLPCEMARGRSINSECLSCGIRDYCMNWCGCSNYFSSGHYDRAGPFLCASEKAAIQTAYRVLQSPDKALHDAFMDHAGGFPIAKSSTRYTRR